jgi:hypothetical protein
MAAKRDFRFDVSQWGTRSWLLCAAAAWLVLAVPASLVMSPVWRLVALAILTGAIFIAVIYELNKKDAGRWPLIGAFGLIWLAGAVTLYLANRLVPREAEISGALVAGNGKTPPTACMAANPALRHRGLLIAFGGDAVIGRGNGPFVPLRTGTCPALSITRTPAGLMVNAFGFDSDDNVVYRIRNNEFEQIVGGFLRGHRPDRSTLIISDDRGIETLAVRYLNQNTVQVRGTFRCGNTRPVRITDKSISIAGVSVGKGQCAIIDSKTPYGIAYGDPGPVSGH